MSVLPIVGAQASGDITLTLPAGIPANSVAFTWCAFNPGSAVPITPAGWTLDRNEAATASFHLNRYRRDVGPSDSGTTVLFDEATTGKMVAFGAVLVGYVANSIVITDGFSATAAATHAALSQSGQSGTRHAFLVAGTRGSAAVTSIAHSSFTTVSSAYNTGSGACAGVFTSNLTDDADGSLGGGTWTYNASQVIAQSLITAQVVPPAAPSLADTLSYPVYIAHRGGANITNRAENTSTAYGLSIANDHPLMMLETDVALLGSGGTPEDRLCLTHEGDDLSTNGRTLEADGTTIVTGEARSKSIAQWDSYLISQRSGILGGNKPASRWYTGNPANPGLCDLLLANPTKIAVPEVKESDALQPLIDSITARGLIGRTIVQSFSYAEAQAIAAAGLNALVLISSFTSPTAAQIYASGIRFVGIDRTNANLASLCTAAHAAGLKVIAYTVNSTANQEAALAAGVDGMFTDRPDLVNAGSTGLVFKGRARSSTSYSSQATVNPDTNLVGTAVAEGDIMFMGFSTQGVLSGSHKPTLADGWQELYAYTGTGNLTTTIWWKKRLAGETTYVVNATNPGGATSTWSWKLAWWSPQPGKEIDTVQLGTFNARATSGTSLTTIATSLTPTKAGTALAFAWERTTATETEAQITVSGTGWSKVFADVSLTDQSWAAAQKNLPDTNASGAVTFTYPNTQTTNAGSLQIIVYEKTATLPDFGRVASAFVPQFFTNALRVGALLSAAVNSWRLVVSTQADLSSPTYVTGTLSTRKWATAKATGLSPGTLYYFGFEVDGILQTDYTISARTLRAVGAPASYKFLAGSCQATGSNHASIARMATEGADFFCHMGDLHYADATTEAEWVNGVTASMTTANQKALMANTPMDYIWDNHDRIILDTLNLGTTLDATRVTYRELAGSADYPNEFTQNRAWTSGRVLFIHTDAWTVRQDPDIAAEPRTMLGSVQKQWLKDTLAAATQPLIVWFCSFPNHNVANGRWNSFTSETEELETWLNARPHIKQRIVMLGGDSHDLRADSGSRKGTGNDHNFIGIPSLNISGIAMGGDTPWVTGGWDIAEGITGASSGSYARCTITDTGSSITFLWEAINGTTGAVLASWTRKVGTAVLNASPGVFSYWNADQQRMIPVVISFATATAGLGFSPLGTGPLGG